MSNNQYNPEQVKKLIKQHLDQTDQYVAERKESFDLKEHAYQLEVVRRSMKVLIGTVHEDLIEQVRQEIFDQK